MTFWVMVFYECTGDNLMESVDFSINRLPIIKLESQLQTLIRNKVIFINLFKYHTGITEWQVTLHRIGR